MIHATALVSDSAEIAEGVEIGPYSIVHDGVRIGPRSVIGSHCIIGHQSRGSGSGLQIGEDATIRSHSVIYGSSVIGSRFTTGHHVTIREGSSFGDDCQVGTLSDIQGECSFGKSVRLHSSVHIGQHTTVRDYVWIFPYSVVTNDPAPPSETRLGCLIDEFAVVATGVVLLPGVRVGRGSLVGANSTVQNDVEPETVVMGTPARFVCLASDIKLRGQEGIPAYPWALRYENKFLGGAKDRWTQGR